MNCKHCGSLKHKDENCHMVKWANFLISGNIDDAPDDRTLLIFDDISDLK